MEIGGRLTLKLKPHLFPEAVIYDVVDLRMSGQHDVSSCMVLAGFLSIFGVRHIHPVCDHPNGSEK